VKQLSVLSKGRESRGTLCRQATKEKWRRKVQCDVTEQCVMKLSCSRVEARSTRGKAATTLAGLSWHLPFSNM
jgi:hypothetical protein